MIKSEHLDLQICTKLRLENEKERSEHIDSGKLSASMLAAPIQWQILRAMGFPTEPVDDYTLRKFKRGEHCEKWITDQIGTIATQVPVEYRGVVGYADALIDTQNWERDWGLIPFEIKSVTNAKFKRIEKSESDRGHILQACLYALSLEKPHFAICYIASDDYRIEVRIYNTEDYKEEIDKIIDKFNEYRERNEIPVFEPIEKWHSNPKYNNYKKYSLLTKEELEKELKEFTTNIKDDSM